MPEKSSFIDFISHFFGPFRGKLGERGPLSFLHSLNNSMDG